MTHLRRRGVIAASPPPAPDPDPGVVVQSAFASTIGSTAAETTVTLPETPTDGNTLVLMIVARQSNPGPDFPAGYTLRADARSGNSNLHVQTKIGTKVADDDPVSLTFDFNTTGYVGVAYVELADVSNVPDDSGGASGTDGAHVLPSLDAAGDGSLLLALWGERQGFWDDPAEPLGMELLAAEDISDLNAASFLAAYELVDTGATGTRTANRDSGNGRFGCCGIVLPPK